MEIIIEKVNSLGLIQSKKAIKLSKGRMIITVGDKKFMVNNVDDKPKVDRIPKEEYINPITQYENEE